MILWKQGDKDHAADVFIEFFKRYQMVFPLPLQIQICRTMVNKYQYDLAARVLESIINEAKTSPHKTLNGPALEQAYILLGRLLADKLECFEPATQVFKEFIKRFPHASQREMVTQKLKLINEQQVVN